MSLRKKTEENPTKGNDTVEGTQEANEGSLSTEDADSKEEHRNDGTETPDQNISLARFKNLLL